MKIPTYEFSGQHRNLNYKTEPGVAKTHVYLFPGGDKVEIKNVASSFVSRHGNHFLKCVDGCEHVIPFTWISLSFIVDGEAVSEPTDGRFKQIEAGLTPLEQKMGDLQRTYGTLGDKVDYTSGVAVPIETL